MMVTVYGIQRCVTWWRDTNISDVSAPFIARTADLEDCKCRVGITF